MLVLQREEGESIVIDTGQERIIITVTRIKCGRVRLGIAAPAHVAVDRMEISVSKLYEGRRDANNH